MKAGCITSAAPTGDEDDTQGKTYLFLSLYFHQLAKYFPRPGILSQRAHFARTLLQNKYPHTSKQRDLNQTVCSLDSTLDGHCFYTPNLWCLMIDNCNSLHEKSPHFILTKSRYRFHVDLGERQLDSACVQRRRKAPKTHFSNPSNTSNRPQNDPPTVRWTPLYFTNFKMLHMVCELTSEMFNPFILPCLMVYRHSCRPFRASPYVLRTNSTLSGMIFEYYPSCG